MEDTDAIWGRLRSGMAAKPAARELGVVQLQPALPAAPRRRPDPAAAHQICPHRPGRLFVQTRGALRRELTQYLRTGRVLRGPKGVRLPDGRGGRPNTLHISARPAEGLSGKRCNWLRHAERCLAGKDRQ